MPSTASYGCLFVHGGLHTDRGGTFTDVVALRPDGTLVTHKLLSENPEQCVHILTPIPPRTVHSSWRVRPSDFTKTVLLRRMKHHTDVAGTGHRLG